MRDRPWTLTHVVIYVLLLIGGFSADVSASPVVWYLEPVSGDIVRIDPLNGVELGRFAAPLKPEPGDTRAGLSIADGGNTLLYQLGGNGTADRPERLMLFRLDPYTGAVLGEELGLATSFGPDGLSWQSQGGDTYTFFSHANPIPDIHRIKNLGEPDEEEIFNYGPTEDFDVFIFGGLGGDGNGREFGAFRVEDDNGDLGPLFIREYDPFDSGSVLPNMFAAPSQDVEGLAFDGRLLYASSASGALFTLDPDTGDVLGTLQLPMLTFLDGSPAPYVFDIAAVPEPLTGTLVLLGAAVATRRFRTSLGKFCRASCRRNRLH